MRGMITLFGLGLAFAATAAGAQDAPANGQIVGQWARPDGFQQTTLISRQGSLGFAVPGDWKAVQFDFKLPVATAVYEVPDPSTLEGGSNTNCSMAFADPATPEGKALVARAGAFGGSDSARNGWTLHSRGDTADAVTTREVVAVKAEGQITAVAMCAWPNGATHDATYDAYMTKLFNTMLDSVQAAPSPFKARPGETFFTPQ